jgi:DNA-binding transcriptional regulator YdaS (Cro superfamily)
MIDIQVRIARLIGIHLGLVELLASNRIVKMIGIQVKIVGFIGIHLGLLDQLVSI